MRFVPVLLLALLPATALAHWIGDRPDGHAPISVMGDHTHAKGEWMLAYRYMGMTMSGQLDGSRDISEAQAFSLVAGAGPMQMKSLAEEMTMEMHMLGGMYAISDVVTLSAGLPYMTREMSSVSKSTMMGMTSYAKAKMETAGVGDVSLSAIIRLYDSTGFRVLLNLGLGLPTGSITEEDFMPMAGMTFLGQTPDWSWGVQASAVFALDDNDQGYRLGQRNQLTGWVARRASDSLSVSLLGRYRFSDDIDGEAKDLRVSPQANPAADPERRQAERVEAGIGLNWLARQGALRGHRLAIEYMLPVYEGVDGPQLGLDHALMLGWQKAWGQ